eukprot:GFYU01009882.1.p2 GENE.GFYU01009882.1~~GFYU01009882.1.p2  ORF type:complete len:102 (-),score=24.65 GFYU01009882.1:198-503(-)
MAVDPADMRKQMNYPLVKESDMNEEMRSDAMEAIVTAIEKHSSNYESACRMVKETMDKKYGPAWHCVAGEGFGFEITHEMKHLIYLFFGGNLAILCWKASG